MASENLYHIVPHSLLLHSTQPYWPSTAPQIYQVHLRAFAVLESFTRNVHSQITKWLSLSF